MKIKKKGHIVKKIVTIFILIYCALVSTLKAAEIGEDPVKFKDDNLKICISETLGIDEDQIQTEDLIKLYSLNCSNMNISNLSGLSSAVNLQQLDLSFNKISDISEIGSLTMLTNLNFNSNNISNISSIETLTYIKDLNLRNNQVSNISSLSELQHLSRLNLANNRISNISALRNLTELKQLVLYQNQVSDLTSISNLTKLTQLLIDDNKITSIAPLEKLTSLKNLSLNNNQVSTLQPLTNITSLLYLSAVNNNLSNLSGIQLNSNLTELYVEDNTIFDISAVSSLENLKMINLSNNKIEDLSSLDKNVDMEMLFAQNNDISDLSGINNLSNLTRLKLNGNDISDITLLSNLIHLVELDLSNNLISDTSSLSSLVNLEKLILNYNNLGNISPLSSITDCQIQANDQIIILRNSQYKPGDVFSVVDKTGNLHEVKLVKLFFFSKQAIGNWNVVSTNTSFSGEVRLELQLTSNLTASAKEEYIEDHPMTDKQLISLFKVKNDKNATIIVDKSNVDFQKPGNYNVIFTDSDGNTITSVLSIIDIKPQIASQVNIINLIYGSKITDYISVYGVTATEHQTGDLNNNIVVDDSAVDYSTEGTYVVKFSASDSEKNVVSKSVKLNVKIREIILNTDSVIHIYKTNRAGRGLSNYEYTIYDKDGNIVEVITTDSKGHAQSISLPAGYYYVKQTGAPNGDSVNEEIISASETINVVETSVNINDNNINNKPPDVHSQEDKKDSEIINLDGSASQTVSLRVNILLKNGETVENVGIYLLADNSEIFGYRVSDQGGQLNFDNVLAGRYQIIIDDVSGEKYKLENDYYITIKGTEYKNSEHDIIIVERKSKLALPAMILVIVSAVVIIYAFRKMEGIK